MKRRPWTTTEETTLRDLYQTHTARDIAAQLGRGISAVYQRAQDIGLKKTRDWIAERARQAMLDPKHGGRARQFQPGLTPWNKGTHFTAGGRSAETRFKAGHRGGRAEALWKPVGSLRINADGYLDRKVHDGLPLHTRWRAEHLLIWEAAHGAIQKNHAVVFKDGDKTNITLDNLECISRSELMLRNTVHRHGPEIAALSQLRGALKRQINRKTRNQPEAAKP